MNTTMTLPPMEEVTVPFIKALSDDNRLRHQEWLTEVARLHSDSRVRRSAMVALRDIRSQLVRPISLLLIAHEEHNENLRETAIRCLGEVGTADDLALLKQLKANEQIARFGKQAAANAHEKLLKRLESEESNRDSPQTHETQAEDRQREPYFDVALSFAGKDRAVAESIAIKLRDQSLRVFYDMFYQSDLIGEDLSRLLGKIYAEASRFCIVLISAHYPQRAWPKFELAQVQERVIFHNGTYLIPVRLDSTHIDGIASTVGCIDLREKSVDQAAELIARKVLDERSGKLGLSELIT